MSEPTRIKRSLPSWLRSCFLVLLSCSCLLLSLIVVFFVWERERQRRHSEWTNHKDHVVFFSGTGFIYCYCTYVCMMCLSMGMIEYNFVRSLLSYMVTSLLHGFPGSNSEHWVCTASAPSN